MQFFGIRMALISICLVSIVVDSFSELVMIHHPSESAHQMSLTCASEDDRAALVWNYDLKHPPSTPKNFSTIWPKTTPKCAIVATSGCITNWEESNAWAVVRSFKYPMGPVFDSRWEDFPESSFSSVNCNHWDYMYVHNVPESNALVFSVRGTGNIFIRLCKTDDLSLNTSLKITNTKRFCTDITARPCRGKISQFNLFFRKALRHRHGIDPKYTNTSLSDDEWRTFVLRWDNRQKDLKVYYDAKSCYPKMFLRRNTLRGNSYDGRVRFHSYEYFLTTKADTELSTLEFDHEEQSFCIELLVSLCADCSLHVYILAKNGYQQIIGNIFGDETELYGKLPTWKTVKLDANLSRYYENPIRLKILTEVTGISSKSRWAIDSFRKCTSKRKSKKAARSVSSVEDSTSNIQCQKLSYGDNSLVRSDIKAARSILNTLEHEPPRGRNITSTTAILSYPEQLNGQIWYTLRYEIKEEKTDWTPVTPILSKSHKLKRDETLIGYLSPRTMYTVRVVVTMKGENYLIEVESVGKNFTTDIEAQSITISSTMLPNVDMESWQRHLIWLIILPIIVLLLVLYRTRENIYVLMKSSPLVEDIAVTPISPIEMPDDKEFDDSTRLIEIKKFEDYVKQAVATGELKNQFEMLPRGMVRPCEYGNLPSNKSKNRYGNLIAYDETRVILGGDTIGFHSNYINANYIQGYCKEKAYIATQAPKSKTIVDFWRMIWQEEVCIISMLVNVVEDGKKMCEQYWPEIGKTVEYGHIMIFNLNQHVYANYTYRTFQLTMRYASESRKVRHLQYTGWPEQGVPMYSDSIVEYLNEMRATPTGPGPIVVHCNAGTGRTGCIILCDICLRCTAGEGISDPFTEAKKMYDARANMLDNLQQYLLAHLMPAQCLFLPSTKLPCSDVTSKKMKELKRALPTHMERLTLSSWKDRALCALEPARLTNPKHIGKLRFRKLLPVEQSLVTLKRYPQHDEYSDYINAVSVDGVRVKKQFIASQLPLPTTLSDCWRLVAENKIELVIILQRPSPEDLSCIDVIPTRTRPIIPVPYIKVEHKSSDDGKYFSIDKLLLTDSSEEPARTQNVTVLTCNNWRLVDNAEPPPPKALVELWSSSEHILRAETPTLVLCRDGITGCGLYLSLNFLLEKMSVEQEFDVISAVRAIRRSRPQFVNSRAQFEYLCDAAVKFLEDFDTYANFT